MKNRNLLKIKILSLCVNLGKFHFGDILRGLTFNQISLKEGLDSSQKFKKGKKPNPTAPEVAGML